MKNLQNDKFESVIERYNKILTTENNKLIEHYNNFKSKIDKTKKNQQFIKETLDNLYKHATIMAALKKAKNGADNEEATTLANKWKENKKNWESEKSLSIEEAHSTSRQRNSPQRYTGEETSTNGKRKRKAQELSTGEDKAPSEAEKAALEAEELKKPLATQLRLDSNLNISELLSGGRSPSPFSGTMGAHTTAWIVRVDRVRTALVGKDVTDAIQIFEKELLKEADDYASKMNPVFPDKWMSRVKKIDSAKQNLKNTFEKAKNATPPDERLLLLQESVNLLLTYENYIPGSTLEVATPVGRSEAKHRKTLMDYQNTTSDQLELAILGLLDFPEEANLSDEQKKALEKAHRDIIFKTYPDAYQKAYSKRTRRK